MTSSSQAPAPAPAAEAPRAAATVARTRPVPQYQPVPDIRVDRTHTVRLDLTIGADGRVKEVGVQNPVPGQTARILATVQAWRFKPATENGVPVQAPFSVELSFRGNE
jgi:TonB family protein